MKKVKKMDKKTREDLAARITAELMKDPAGSILLQTLVAKAVETMFTSPELLETVTAFLPLEEVEGPAGSTAPRKTTARKAQKNPALFNPFEVAQEGMEVLRERITALEVPQMKDIIRDYDLDPHGKVKSCRKPERFIDHILETVEARLKAGSGYKSSL